MNGRSFLVAGVLCSAAFVASCGTDSAKGVGDGCLETNPVTGECISGSNVNPNNSNIGTNINPGSNNDTTGSNNANNRDPWADSDGDGFIDRFDNCPDAENPGQEDPDGDGIGEACDNCNEASNFDQADSDGNGVGDACEGNDFYDPDRDDDGDGIPDNQDNCFGIANADQADADNDSIGDQCDNCAGAANFDQFDSDMNGVGDACEPAPAGMICGENESMFTIVEPNIYILLDRSGSMGQAGIDQATAALDGIADELFDEVRFGFGTFQTGSCPGLEHRLDMGNHTAAGLKASWNNLGPGGGTPTAESLGAVRQQGLTSDAADPLDASRAKAVILVTDGQPNDCGGLAGSITEAGNFAAMGIPVYVIAFNFGGSASNLNQIAMAGGTDAPPVGGDLFYTANDTVALNNALRNIAAEAIACSYTLNPAAPDASKIWVELDGNLLPRTSYTYDQANNTLTLNQASCDQLRMLDPMGMGAPLRIIFGCATDCEPTDEVCDYIDNDCDMEIDEGCEGCSPEICDGIDNDCDDAVDEGCPDCVLDGEACETDADCCNGNCREDLGVCAPPCRPLNTSCRENSDCCSNSCAKMPGEEVGICIGG